MLLSIILHRLIIIKKIDRFFIFVYNAIMYKIYIDGSHHYQSGISGWGFAVYKHNKSIYEAYGEVPSDFLLEHEQFAYSQALYFMQKTDIKEAIIYTDLKILEKIHHSMTAREILQWAKKYATLINEDYIMTPTTQYIERKFNKIADRLSRRFLIDLYEKERNDFLVLHGQPRERKVNFFHMDYLAYSVKKKNIEKKVLHAIKKEHAIFNVNGRIMEIFLEKNKEKQVVCYKTINSERDIIQEVLNYATIYKKILLVIPDYPQLFDDIIYHAPRVAPIIEKVNQIFVYNKTLDSTAPRKNSKKKNYEYSIVEILEKAKTSNRYFQVLIGRDIDNFKKNNGRTPNKEELSLLVENRKIEFNK